MYLFLPAFTRSENCPAYDHGKVTDERKCREKAKYIAAP